MGAIRGVPHPFPYQGSKRQLASWIVRCVPRARRLVEPFAGSAAIALAVAFRHLADRFWINDAHRPLAGLWREIIHRPQQLAAGYSQLWTAQAGRERAFYDQVRARFNRRHEPSCFLYLLARCVKAAVRYNSRGEFNNSPDNRRKGMRPTDMARNILSASELLRGRVEVSSEDYRTVLGKTDATDVIYMDPPYQGVCGVRDHRYCGGVNFDEFVDALADLNRRDVPYIVSYDGRTGAKVHGRPLPRSLRLVHREILVGRSTQATLLGRDHRTYESLYLSPSLVAQLGRVPPHFENRTEDTLFAMNT